MILKNFGREYLSGNTISDYLQAIGAVAGFFIFWLCYFIVFRGIFLIYHFPLSSKLNSGLILGTFYHGLKMDISFSSYLTMFVLVTLSLSIMLSGKTTEKAITSITVIFLVLISILSIADLELFKEWGFRLDATPLMYLNTPGEMMASIASSPYLLLSLAMAVSLLTSIKIYRSQVLPRFRKLNTPKLLLTLVYFLGAGLMIIPIRGGLQLAPMNQSAAFFSNNDFVNQAAINVPWNFFWSLGKQLYSRKNPYQFMSDQQASEMVREFYKSDTLQSIELLNNAQPNVIIILWESLTSKVVSALGGSYSGVVPEFESLIKEGILFTDFYANGNRSDKGIIAVLSGYPAQPRRSIVKIPVKSSKLPVMTKALHQNGYHTGYFHGGELAFANIKSYLINAEFNTIVGKSAFEKRDMSSKWGAHDHIVLERALKDIEKQPVPFFNLIFTLSSHEPFDIPVAPRFTGDDLESLYMSSLHYADQSVGTFIREAKKQSWYENTLIIILADHGHRLLGDAARYQKARFHIPMLWLGGALNVRDTVFSQTCSQTDIAKTLLNQLQIDASEFIWSRNVFNSGYKSGAYYIYNEGVGYVNGQEQLIYDHPSDKLLVRTQYITDYEVELCRAHLQVTYQDYLNK